MDIPVALCGILLELNLTCVARTAANTWVDGRNAMAMKCLKSVIQDGAVTGKCEAYFEVTVQEADELWKALDVVAKFKKAGLRQFGNRTKEDADWTMYRFYKKRHKDKAVVTVEITEGMCG
jgi:hypothetical protein